MTSPASPLTCLRLLDVRGAKAQVVSSNVSLLLVPLRASELNRQEDIWKLIRQNGCETGSSNYLNEIAECRGSILKLAPYRAIGKAPASLATASLNLNLSCRTELLLILPINCAKQIKKDFS